MLSKLEQFIGEIGGRNCKLILLVEPSRTGKIQMLKQFSKQLKINQCQVHQLHSTQYKQGPRSCAS